MKILHVIPSLESGGAERMLSKIISNDRTNSHYILYYRKSNIKYDFSNAKIYHFDKFNLKIILKLLLTNFDLVNTWMRANTLGLLFKFLFLKSKIVFNIRHDLPTNKSISTLLEHFVIWQSRFIDGTIFVSYSGYKNYIANGYNSKNSLVIPNGFTVPTEMMYKRKKTGKQIIGYVGRYNPIKNQDRLLAIFNELSYLIEDVELWLIGLNLDKLLSNKQMNNNDNIKVFGQVNDLHDIYSSFNMLILTSKKEGFPNVIGEAMSYGVPVASTNAGDSLNIIGNYGISINSQETAKQTALKIATILKDSEKMEMLSRRSYLRIKENFNIKDILNDYMRFYINIKEK